MRSLKSAAISGVKWSALSYFGRRGLSLLTSIVLARLLAPADFGLVAMAAVAIGFIELFKDLGTAAAVVQREELPDSLLAALFWLNAGAGLAGMLVLFFASPWAGSFYREPRVVPIMQALSVSLALSGLSNVQMALLERKLEFGKLAQIEFGSALVASAVGICAAFLGYGAWSLVYQMLTGNFLGTLLFWILSGWRPARHFSWREVRSVMGFSLNLTGSNIVNYFSRNADKLLIGRILGIQNLGYYELAYRLMQLPLQGIAAVLGRVMFPLFSRMQNDPRLFATTYLKVVSLIALITFPLMLGLFALAAPFVLALFGAAWAPVIPLLWVLAPLGAMQSILTTIGTIYTATGRTDIGMWCTAVFGSLFILSFVLGLPWGIMGVTSSYAIMNLLVAYPAFAIPFRLIGLRVRDLGPVLGRTALCSVLMCGIVVASVSVLPAGTPDWLVLTMLPPIGALAYAALSLRFNRALFLEALQLLRDAIRPRTDAAPSSPSR